MKLIIYKIEQKIEGDTENTSDLSGSMGKKSC